MVWCLVVCCCDVLLCVLLCCACVVVAVVWCGSVGERCLFASVVLWCLWLSCAVVLWLTCFVVFLFRCVSFSLCCVIVLWVVGVVARCVLLMFVCG